MEHAYNTESWHDLYIFMGGAAAALMGLVFLALSLHLIPIIQSVLHRAQARAGLGMLFCVVVISALVLIPGQPNWLLGAEFVLYGAGFSAYIARNIIRTRREAPTPIIFGAPALASFTVLVVGGVSLATHQAGGLYWLAAASLSFFANAIFLSWHLMVALAEHDAVAPR